MMLFEAIPLVAVGCDNGIFIYKKMEPVYVFMIPQNELPKIELSLYTLSL